MGDGKDERVSDFIIKGWRRFLTNGKAGFITLNKMPIIFSLQMLRVDGGLERGTTWH